MYNRQPNLTICFLVLYMFLIQNLHIMLQMHCSTWHLPDNTDSFVHVNF